VVVPAWTSEWLDTDRPTHERWKVQGIKRPPSSLCRLVFFVADGGCRSGYNCTQRDCGLPMAAHDYIRCRRGRIRRSAHVHANWHHLDTAPCSTYAIGFGGEWLVQSEGYSECDGHCLGMYLPERLGFCWRRCTYRGLSGWGRTAHDGGCSYGNGHCSHCLSRVGSRLYFTTTQVLRTDI
jgi:hypothetical protein